MRARIYPGDLHDSLVKVNNTRRATHALKEHNTVDRLIGDGLIESFNQSDTTGQSLLKRKKREREAFDEYTDKVAEGLVGWGGGISSPTLPSTKKTLGV